MDAQSLLHGCAVGDEKTVIMAIVDGKVNVNTTDESGFTYYFFYKNSI